MQNQNPSGGLTFEQKLDICKSMPEGGYGSQEKTECFKSILGGNDYCHSRPVDFGTIAGSALVLLSVMLLVVALYKILTI